MLTQKKKNDSINLGDCHQHPNKVMLLLESSDESGTWYKGAGRGIREGMAHAIDYLLV